MSPLIQHAQSIWWSAVKAADPFARVLAALDDPAGPVRTVLARGGRVAVLGGGKAGAAMARAVEVALSKFLDQIVGIVNVPEGQTASLSRVQLRAARPAGSNHPSAAGVAATLEQLTLAQTLGPGDLALCLFSGGGSALLPAPVPGVTLEDKQGITRLLHACGASIEQMNCVRKHLSRYKGGRLAQCLVQRQVQVLGLIISDVIGDPLDVIASGPTAADPTTFSQALAILEQYDLLAQTPPAVLDHLKRGCQGRVEETPKSLPDLVSNQILANNREALAAAARLARQLGYEVIQLGSYFDGETRHVAQTLAALVRSVRQDGLPAAPPLCLLSGGETTVTLGTQPGKGGRNQEFVLASLLKLGQQAMAGVVVLSGGTDGEDGPTDAAGALASAETLARGQVLGLNAQAHLDRHDAYPYFEAVGGLLKTGLTGTNVMDVRVVLVAAGDSQL